MRGSSVSVLVVALVACSHNRAQPPPAVASVPEIWRDAAFWLDPTPTVTGDSNLCPAEIGVQLHRAVERQLVSAGYHLTTQGTPDSIALTVQVVQGGGYDDTGSLVVKHAEAVLGHLSHTSYNLCNDNESDAVAAQLVDALARVVPAAPAQAASPPPPPPAAVTPPPAPQRRELLHATSLLLLDFRREGAVAEHVPRLITKILASELDGVRGLKVITLEDVQAMLDVQKQRDLVGCDATACMAEIGGALGAELVLYGTLGLLGSKYSMTASIVDTKASTPRGRVAVLIPADDNAVGDKVPELVDQIVARLNEAR